jgi:hypothetical protein
MSRCLLKYGRVFEKFALLRRVEQDPGSSVQRTAVTESISIPLFWRIPHEQSVYPLEAVTPPDHRARAVFCQWLLANSAVNTQFVANILFNDEVGFPRDDILNSGWMTVPTAPWHRASTSISRLAS